MGALTYIRKNYMYTYIYGLSIYKIIINFFIIFFLLTEILKKCCWNSSVPGCFWEPVTKLITSENSKLGQLQAKERWTGLHFYAKKFLYCVNLRLYQPFCAWLIHNLRKDWGRSWVSQGLALRAWGPEPDPRSRGTEKLGVALCTCNPSAPRSEVSESLELAGC